MYKRQDFQQFTIEEFSMPFGGKLRTDNRWVKLEAMMPWEFIEDIYAESMSMDTGAPAISSRIAFGAQFIKESENLTDERTVEYIAENPYMQYFLGLREYRDTPLFDPSMMARFRRRFPAEKVEEINKRIFAAQKDRDSDDDDTPPNSGKLVLDTTCAPADIRYPGDLSLLNEARENTEDVIEELWEHSTRTGRKTRYNRRKARSHYLAVAKQKKPSHKRTRQAIGKQLGYVRSNLDRIGELLPQAGLEVLPEKRILRLLTICELYRQQSGMYRERTLRTCSHRRLSNV